MNRLGIYELRRKLEALGYYVHWTSGATSPRAYQIHSDGKSGLIPGDSLMDRPTFETKAKQIISYHS